LSTSLLHPQGFQEASFPLSPATFRVLRLSILHQLPPLRSAPGLVCRHDFLCFPSAFAVGDTPGFHLPGHRDLELHAASDRFFFQIPRAPRARPSVLRSFPVFFLIDLSQDPGNMISFVFEICPVGHRVPVKNISSPPNFLGFFSPLQSFGLADLYSFPIPSGCFFFLACHSSSDTNPLTQVPHRVFSYSPVLYTLYLRYTALSFPLFLRVNGFCSLTPVPSGSRCYSRVSLSRLSVFFSSDPFFLLSYPSEGRCRRWVFFFSFRLLEL